MLIIAIITMKKQETGIGTVEEKNIKEARDNKHTGKHDGNTT